MHSGTERFNPLEFLHYLRVRAIVVAVCCGFAVIVALGISLALPKRYTAAATILIELPGGNDPRAATAVSQVYLDSLKTYESFATSDTLFVQALNHLHLVDPHVAIESLKQGVLQVVKPANTSILQISVTWQDARKAQALAQHIAEQTVELSRSIEARSFEELLRGIRDETAAALKAWKDAQERRQTFIASHPVDILESEVDDLARFRPGLDRDLALAKADVAELEARQKDGTEIAAVRARADALETQRHELAERLKEIGLRLEVLKARRTAMDDDVEAAFDAYDALEGELNGMLASTQSHGARLEIIDPGIVPRKPVSPDTRLNMIAAFFAALVASFTWLVSRFSYSRLVRESAERVYSLR